MGVGARGTSVTPVAHVAEGGGPDPLGAGAPVADAPPAEPPPVTDPPGVPSAPPGDGPAPAVTATPPPEPAPVAASPAPPLPAGTTVLHVGDSFAGALGVELNRRLRAAGIHAILEYQTATYIPTWASGKDLEKFLDHYRPDLVLVTLGANELEITDPESRAPTVRRLVAHLGGRPCVWVGPSLWPGARPELLAVIRANVAPCAYLDSEAIVPGLPRARDHIHPSTPARAVWADAVVDWLTRHRATGGERPWEIIP